jgi:hypothetical protein
MKETTLQYANQLKHNIDIYKTMLDNIDTFVLQVTDNTVSVLNNTMEDRVLCKQIISLVRKNLTNKTKQHQQKLNELK